ncbi:uncharacterized protein LOC126754938 [Bactrocera neohumeralis]|uniref:uncharacterized protein LOC126754938 n=1 Tax=Bactrocera neohumeralis TaxID=98809 RepID=UPI002165F15F|nr:uncharacterized protein LOC126754938 [Bactrocera neohumeralis]
MLRCIRFGEVLLDETFRTFLICNQCQAEFVEVPEFRVHLATTPCGQRLFKEDVIGLKFGAAQVTRTSKEKTYLLYNPADVQLATTETVISSATGTAEGGDDAYLDLMKIEEELLDPRWYTDIANAQTEVTGPQAAGPLSSTINANKPMEYKELVEAVGPYVQFKENAAKRKPNSVVVRRFPNKSDNSAVAKNNPVLQTKLEPSNDQKSVRLLNPAVKRKLDMAPKQVQFNDKTTVKYVINEKLCTNSAPITEEITLNNGAVVKRRKTINIPTEQTSMRQDLQEQAIRRSSDVPKSTIGIATVRKTVTQPPNAVGANKTAKSHNITIAPTVVSSKIVAPAKLASTAAPKTDAAAKIKGPLPNTRVIATQMNGKNQIIHSNLLVKNPITYARANSNGITSEKPLPNRTASVSVNKVAPIATKPQPRTVTTSGVGATPVAVVASMKQTAPPALAPLSSSNPTATAQQKTNDILNKLQTRGLQVKRTQPPVTTSVNTSQQNKTLELLQKLQSKGMKVKILNGKEALCASGATVAQTSGSINLPTTAVRDAKVVCNVGSTALAMVKPNKTILNNKLIIKKVK